MDSPLLKQKPSRESSDISLWRMASAGNVSVVEKVLNTDLFAIALAIFVILPFLEPWSAESVSDSGFLAPVSGWIVNVTTFIRASISILSFLLLIKFRTNWDYVLFPVLFSFGCVASLAVNGDLSISQIATPVQYAGFTILLIYLYDTNRKKLIQALLLSFFLLVAMALVTVFAMGGIIHSDSAAGVIYSFGGKNSLFVTLVPFVSLLGVKLAKGGRSSFAPFAVSLGFAVLSRIVDSSGSLVCFLALAILLLPIGSDYLIQKINTKVIIAAIVFLFFGTVATSAITDSFDTVFSLLGRDSNFTNRDTLWGQAIARFFESPVFGVGTSRVFELDFMLESVSTSIAHCYYLDIAAKYGLLALVPFVLDACFLLWRCRVRKLQAAFVPAMAVFSVIALHSCYDDLLLYFYAVARVLAYAALKEQKGASEARNDVAR